MLWDGDVDVYIPKCFIVIYKLCASLLLLSDIIIIIILVLIQFSLWIAKSNSEGFVHAYTRLTPNKRFCGIGTPGRIPFLTRPKPAYDQIIEQVPVLPSINKLRHSVGNKRQWAASQNHSHIINSLPFTACRLAEVTIRKLPLPPGGQL